MGMKSIWEKITGRRRLTKKDKENMRAARNFFYGILEKHTGLPISKWRKNKLMKKLVDPATRKAIMEDLREGVGTLVLEEAVEVRDKIVPIIGGLEGGLNDAIQRVELLLPGREESHPIVEELRGIRDRVAAGFDEIEGHLEPKALERRLEDALEVELPYQE